MNPTADQMEDLQSRAEKTLSLLKESPLCRPLFVEFAGTPKSGKSTQHPRREVNRTINSF